MRRQSYYQVGAGDDDESYYSQGSNASVPVKTGVGPMQSFLQTSIDRCITAYGPRNIPVYDTGETTDGPWVPRSMARELVSDWDRQVRYWLRRGIPDAQLQPSLLRKDIKRLLDMMMTSSSFESAPDFVQSNPPNFYKDSTGANKTDSKVLTPEATSEFYYLMGQLAIQFDNLVGASSQSDIYKEAAVDAVSHLGEKLYGWLPEKNPLDILEGAGKWILIGGVIIIGGYYIWKSQQKEPPIIATETETGSIQ